MWLAGCCSSWASTVRTLKGILIIAISLPKQLVPFFYLSVSLNFSCDFSFFVYFFFHHSFFVCWYPFSCLSFCILSYHFYLLNCCYLLCLFSLFSLPYFQSISSSLFLLYFCLTVFFFLSLSSFLRKGNQWYQRGADVTVLMWVGLSNKRHVFEVRYSTFNVLFAFWVLTRHVASSTVMK